MKSIKFRPDTIKIAENQEEYETVHVFHNPNESTLTMCFELSKEHLDEIYKTGKIYYKQYIGDRQMQPMCLSSVESELIPDGFRYLQDGMERIFVAKSTYRLGDKVKKASVDNHGRFYYDKVILSKDEN